MNILLSIEPMESVGIIISILLLTLWIVLLVKFFQMAGDIREIRDTLWEMHYGEDDDEEADNEQT